MGKAYSNSSIKSSFLRHFLPAARSSRAVASCAAPAVGLSLMGRPRPFEPTLNPCSFCVGGGVNSTPRYALRVINSPSALFKAERVAMSQGNLPNEHQLLLTVLPEPYSGLPALPCPVPKALLFQSARDGGAQRWVGAANFYHLLHCARFIFPILLIWPAVHHAIYLTSLIAAVKLLNQAEIPSLIRSTF